MATGISLHLGINRVDPAHYDGWAGPLTACEADADDMQALAASRGFTTHVFKTREVTRALVRSQLETHARVLKAGDVLFVTYSGHGGTLPDENDDELDGQDETWCLYDGEILDDELAQLYGRFAAGVRVVVLSDSCHSGTVLKDAFSAALLRSGAIDAMLPEAGAAAVPRQMPRDVAVAVYRKHRAFYDDLQANIPATAEQEIAASALLISGCADNQTSLDGTFNGLFTATLKKVWNKGAFTADYTAFHAAIVKRMPPTQTPRLYQIGAANPAFVTQRPFSI